MDVADRADRTIMVVQYANSGIAWTEPRDLSFDQMSYRVNDDANRESIRSDLPHEACVGLASGGFRALAKDTSPDLVREMLAWRSSVGRVPGKGQENRPCQTRE
jgi:hypothetical protein